MSVSLADSTLEIPVEPAVFVLRGLLDWLSGVRWTVCCEHGCDYRRKKEGWR
jgi:hypothetical protein